MRIVAGEYRSRRIETRSGNETRPTLDKVREAVFSSLGGFFEGGNVLDLYAGSGANGLEALSRGFSHAYFSDISREAVDCIRKNIASLKCEERCTVSCVKDKKMLKMMKEKGITFDLVYLDPPYQKQINDEILRILNEEGLLNEGARVVIESDKKDQFHTDYGSLRYISEKEYGMTRITYYKYGAE